MKYVEQKLFFNELKYDAVSKVLTELDSTVEEQLHKTFEDLYLNLISKETRADIDKRIADAESAEQAAAEASPRFAVYHLHEGKNDYYFTDELRNTFLSAATTYKGMVEKGVLNQTIDSIAHSCFSEHQQIDALTFLVLTNAKENDQRINAVVEFDFDSGKMIVSEGGDKAYYEHELNDIVKAVDTAFECKEKMHLYERNMLFKDELNSIEMQKIDENLEEACDMVQQM